MLLLEATMTYSSSILKLEAPYFFTFLNLASVISSLKPTTISLTLKVGPYVKSYININYSLDTITI